MHRIDFCGDMRPTIVIPDVHETVHWKGFLERRRPGDRAIFLGDYFDRRGNGPFALCVDNFLEICAYARENPDTHLLLGNHDHQYTPWARWAPEPWGYRERMIRQAILSNLDILEIVLVDDAARAVFSHSGLTNSFLRDNGLSDPADVNRLWRKRPQLFEWREGDPETGAQSCMTGDDPGSPRPGPETWPLRKTALKAGARSSAIQW